MISAREPPSRSGVTSVADLIVRHLHRAAVGFLFGVPGGGSNLDLIDAAGRAGLTFVLTSTETAAGSTLIETRIDPATYAETLHTIRG